MRTSPTETGPPKARIRAAVVLTALAALVFVGGTWLAPAIAGTHPRAASVLRFAYSPVCHQQPERCLRFAGAPLAVCARCTGLYVGGTVGLLAGAVWWVGRRRLRPRWLFIAAAPTAVDALLPWVGLPQLSSVPRAGLAAVAGVAAGLFLALAVADLFSSERDAPRRRATVAAASPRVLEELDG